MKRTFDNGIQFNNGNINFRFTKTDLDIIKDNALYPFTDDWQQLNECLFYMDVYFTGEDTYYWNYQGWILYSYNTEKEYELFTDDMEKLMEGKTIKLHARKPSEETLARMEVK